MNSVVIAKLIVWAIFAIVCLFFWQIGSGDDRTEDDKDQERRNSILRRDGYNNSMEDLKDEVYQLERKLKEVRSDKKVFGWIAIILFFILVLQNTFGVSVLQYFSCKNRSFISDECPIDY